VGYPKERKEAVLKKMLPPSNKSIPAIAKEEGISAATLYNWRKAARAEGRLMPDGDTSPEGWGSADKFSAVLETASMNEAALSAYCREKGLYPEQIAHAEVTVDWFHIVQTFTRALDEVRKKESHVTPLPKHVRWAVLKNGKGDRLTTNQLNALAELLYQGLDTATAWRIKERLQWIRQAKTERAARWRITRFINSAKAMIGDSVLLEPVTKARETLGRNVERVVRRWTSTYTNVHLEGLNSLFQAARARARGYRNNETFLSMIYMIASPAGSILKST